MATLQEQIDSVKFELARKSIMLRPDHALEAPIDTGTEILTMIGYDADPNLITRASANQYFPQISGEYLLFTANVGTRFSQSDGTLWICTQKSTSTTNPIWTKMEFGASGETEWDTIAW
jgi:hypothetical protein